VPDGILSARWEREFTGTYIAIVWDELDTREGSCEEFVEGVRGGWDAARRGQPAVTTFSNFCIFNLRPRYRRKPSRTDPKIVADAWTSTHDHAGVKVQEQHVRFHSLVTDHPILFPTNRLSGPFRQEASPSLFLIPEQSSHT
jgi:hypothetical protein